MTISVSADVAATSSHLDALFAPRGIAVIGASSEPDKLGSVMAQAVSAYEGPVALVNPRNPQMYDSIGHASRDLGGLIDLAILCVPAAVTADVLRAAAEAGVSTALVCAGGFAEAGGPGTQYQQDVVDVIAATGLRVLGPNTSGFFVPHRGLTASFVPGVSEISAGSVGVVSSSGGVNHSLSFRLEQAGVGVSLGVGIGAGIDITAADVVEHLTEDPTTHAIALHIETVTDGPRLMNAIRRASRRKPVVAMVVGKNDVAEFAQSHTGVLATSWRSTCAALRQNGAVLVADETELVSVVSALSKTRIQPHPSPGVGLITGQAGPGLIAADHLSGAKVSVPALAASTTDQLSTLLPPLTFQGNPVDTGRPGETFPAVIRAVAADPGIDAIGIYGILEPVVDFPRALGAAEIGKTAAVLSVDGPTAQVQEVIDAGAAAGLPVVSGPTALAHSLAGLARDSITQHALQLPPLESQGITLGDGPWDEVTAKELLRTAGVRIPQLRRADSHSGAHAALSELQGPVAVKLIDAQVLHKTDIGGVHLGISTEQQLDSALAALDRAGAREYLIEEMAPGGIDLVVGARRDPVFGIVMLLGLGGTAVEVIGDVALGVHPLRVGTTEAMIDELATGTMLQGWRGGPSIDPAALAEILSALGETLRVNPHVDEIEINPLRLTDDGLVALDAVIVADRTRIKED
ncbi:acetate--CoA ligase family protein [Nesterenkonia sp. CF4.4]|uniref:acetate--CoA ligase family protein n=1 Tax=Nesterenkonia sp. CF4.4 TaxID=3373079 RepID=UPI003EE765D9